MRLSASTSLHGADIAAVIGHDRRSLQVQNFRTEFDTRIVRQVLRVGQDSALMLWVPMEDINAGADQIVGLDRQQVFDLADQFF